MGWSFEQQLAFETCGRNILVAAAAGSGKTTVLTERIVRHIIGDPDFDITKLLVVTFTKAAAMEMRSRIGKRLKEIDDDPEKNFIEKLLTEHEVYRREIGACKERGEDCSKLEALMEKYSGYYTKEFAEDGSLKYQAKKNEIEGLRSRLNRQRLRLDDANISTIDSFCQKIVREYGDKGSQTEGSRFDARCRVAADTELGILKQDVLEELFLEKYTEAFVTANGDSDFLRFVENYGNDLNDGKIYEIILKIYEYSVSEPNPIAWLESLKDDYENITSELVNKPQPVGKERHKAAVWMNIRRRQAAAMAKKACDQMDAALREAEEAEAELGEIEKFGKHFSTILETVRQNKQLIEKNVDEGRLYGADWDELAAGFKESFASKFGTFRLGKSDTIGEKELEELKARKEKIKALRDAGKKTYEAIGAVFAQNSSVIAANLATFGRFARVAVDLVIDFSNRYRQAKIERRIMDFGDMEHEALNILAKPVDGSRWRRTEIGEQIVKGKYSEVMVDEYQDVNRLQETLFTLLTGPETADGGGRETAGPCRFIVGDVKQSIYRFRHSDASLFNEKKSLYPAVYDRSAINENPLSLRIDMANNYRSRSGVLRGVNFIFRQLMTKGGAEIDYDEKTEALNFILGEDEDGLPVDNGYPYESTRAREKVEFTDEKNELVLIEANKNPAADSSGSDDEAGSTTGGEREELTSFDLEAEYIARRIRELLDSRCHIFGDKDKGEHHVVAPRDITILLRSMAGKGEILREHLIRHNIPVYVAADEGYFQETEIRVALSLLRIIDNTRQDIPLAAVLRSPIGGFSDMELAELRVADQDRQRDLIDVLRQSQLDGSTIGSELKEKVKWFLDRLDEWYRLARESGLSELIWQLLRDTDYYDYVGALPGGQLRQANLRLLVSRAKEYEAGEERGLFRFLHYVSQLKKGKTDMSQARTLGENENVVRIMTIHKSKGMQFPIVILAGLGKLFNQQDERAAIVFHHKLGLGGSLVATHYEISGNPADNDLLRVKQKTVSGEAIKNSLNREMKAEELRLLYVALTRAQEKIIMVGAYNKKSAGNNPGKKWLKFCDYVRRHSVDSKPVPLPDEAVPEGRSMADWIATAIANHRDGEVLRRLFSEQTEAGDGSCISGAGYPAYNCSYAVKILDRNLQDMTVPLAEHESYPDNSDADNPAPVEDSPEASAADFLTAVEKGLAFAPEQEYKDGKLTAELDSIFNEREKYRYPATGYLRAKISVTELKRAEMESSPEDIEEWLDSQPDFRSLYHRSGTLAGNSGDEAEEKNVEVIPAGPKFGTIVHDVLRQAVIRKLAPGSQEMNDCILSAVKKVCPGYSEEVQNKWAGSVKRLTGNFLDSPLGHRARNADKVFCELPFCRLLSADAAYAGKYPDRKNELKEIDQPVFLQGVIDLLVREGDSYILVDYKTDRGIDGKTAKERYRRQAEIYAAAIQEITGCKVNEAYIFLLRNREAVRVCLPE